MVMMIRERRWCDFGRQEPGLSSFSFGGGGATIVTYTGKSVCPLALKSNDICLEDIAHSLSRTRCFDVQCKAFYSLAEHSLNVMRAAVNLAMHLLGGQRDSFDATLVSVQQAALLHEGARAYLVGPFGILCRPLLTDGLKSREVEWVAMTGTEVAVRNRIVDGLEVDLGVDSEAVWRVVDLADQICVATELRDIIGIDLSVTAEESMAMPRAIEPRFTADEAKVRFLGACEMLGIGV